MTTSYHRIRRWLQYGVMKAAQIDKYLRGKRGRPVIDLTYKLIAPIYDSSASKLLGDYQEVAIGLLHHVHLQESDTLLDLGCGTGVITLPAAKTSRLSMGIDLSIDMLQQLMDKRQPIEHPFVAIGNGLRLPFADQTFDKVVTGFMLLHLNTEEKMRVFVEVHRVLKRGGCLACLSSRDTIASVYTERNKWQQMLHNAGFMNIQVQEVGDVYRYVSACKS